MKDQGSQPVADRPESWGKRFSAALSDPENLLKLGVISGGALVVTLAAWRMKRGQAGFNFQRGFWISRQATSSATAQHITTKGRVTTEARGPGAFADSRRITTEGDVTTRAVDPSETLAQRRPGPQ